MAIARKLRVACCDRRQRAGGSDATWSAPNLRPDRRLVGGPATELARTDAVLHSLIHQHRRRLCRCTSSRAARARGWRHADLRRRARDDLHLSREALLKSGKRRRHRGGLFWARGRIPHRAVALCRRMVRLALQVQRRAPRVDARVEHAAQAHGALRLRRRARGARARRADRPGCAALLWRGLRRPALARSRTHGGCHLPMPHTVHRCPMHCAFSTYCTH